MQRKDPEIEIGDKGTDPLGALQSDGTWEERGRKGVRALGDPGKGAQQKRETASIGLGRNELGLSYIYKQNLGGRTRNLHVSLDCL